MPKQDFRKNMNAILEVFYKIEGTVNLIKAMKDLRVPIDIDNIEMICESLERDGYVSLIKGFSQVPVGRITGQGRIFFEQGGYRDTATRFDRMTDWFKNHAIASIGIFIFVILSSLFGFVVMIKEVMEWVLPVK